MCRFIVHLARTEITMAKAESGRITGREVKKNRDSGKAERLLQVELTDPQDIQTVELMSQTGEESNPPIDSKTTVLSIGEAWKLAIATSDKIVPDVAPGEKKIYSTDSTGATIKTKVHLKNDGTIIIDNGVGSITLSPTGEMTIIAPDDTTVTSPIITNIGQVIGSQGLQINGTTPGGQGGEFLSGITSNGDIVATLVSLFSHTHTGVQTGVGTSGPPVGGGGGPPATLLWGGIGGTLSNQVDLQAALDAKWGTPANAEVLLLIEEPYTTAEKGKLAGIEAGAEVNNVSDSDATELTGGGETTLHEHPGGGGGTSEHSELNELPWSESDHIIDTDIDMGGYALENLSIFSEVHVSNGALISRKYNAVNSAGNRSMVLGAAIVDNWVVILKENIGGVTATADGTDTIAGSPAGGFIRNTSADAFGSICLICLIAGRWSIYGAPLGQWSTGGS